MTQPTQTPRCILALDLGTTTGEVTVCCEPL